MYIYYILFIHSSVDGLLGCCRMLLWTWMCILTNSARGFCFLCILANPYFLFYFVAFLMGVRWYRIVVLSYIFIMISDVEHLFHVLWPFVYLLCRNVCSSLSPFLNQIFLCVFVDVPLYILGINSFRYIICTYFNPFCRLPVHSVDYVL